MNLEFENKDKFCLNTIFTKNYMSTETLTKENTNSLKKSNLDSIGLKENSSHLQISNLDLNKIKNQKFIKKKTKICINTLQQKLRKKEVKEKFENRILYGLFISAVAVLFYVST